MDASRDAMEEEEESEEFLLLEEYCTQQEKLRLRRSGVGVIKFQGPAFSRHSKGTGLKPSSISSDSVPIAEGDLTVDGSSPEHQQDLVEKLVVLLKKAGDDINQKIQQNQVLQQQLQGAFSYSLFQRLMAALQGGRPVGSEASGGAPAPPASEARLRKEQIAWVFEVTDRLSTIDQIPKRRALSLGSRFLRQNHSDWVQQHGGWEGVLPVKGERGFTCTSTDLS